MTLFEQKVFKLVKKIPKGKVSTYQILAQKLGNKKSSQAVGNALSKNLLLIKIPCHRIVKSTGYIGNYALGLAKKRRLLQNEGILINKDKIASLTDYLYTFN